MSRILATSVIAACLAAGAVVPSGVASAAPTAQECVARADQGVSGPQMADEYEPYIDTTPRTVGEVPGHYVSTSALYDIQGMPDGATWAIATQNNLTEPIMVQRRGDQLELLLYHWNRQQGAPHRSIQPGPNTTDKLDIRICYPDNSTELVRMHPQLVPTHAYLYDLIYESPKADPGQRLTLTPSNGNYRDYNTDPVRLPKDVDGWSVSSHARWDVHIDDRGTVTTTVPTNTDRGSNFTVAVRYADGTTDEAQFYVANSGKGVSSGGRTETPAAGPTTQKPAGKKDAGKSGSAASSKGDNQSGSSTAQVAALIIGLIAAIGGAVAFLLPQLADIFGDGLSLPV